MDQLELKEQDTMVLYNPETEEKQDNSDIIDVSENSNSCQNNEQECKTNSCNQQYNMYIQGLEAAVEQYKKMYPEKYEKAQSIGDDMMNKNYELNSGEDYKGDILKCKDILVSVLQYGLTMSDLYEHEIDTLKKIFGCVLNIAHDINDILDNVEMIENIISTLTNKLKELDYYY
uniref:Uncharacterized protein n=1 Tax=viral metagenome TaxID=1070528 RepID=A0A6C0I7Q1_9ZZZZ